MLLKKPSIFNIYKFLSDARLLLISVISLVCCPLFPGCARNPPQTTLSVENRFEISASAVDINVASAEELEKLPGVGKETARRIIARREEYGKFRRPEHLILVRGMSDKRFRAVRTLVKAE